MNSRADQLKALDRLLTIMDELREQCPWDRKQTFQSLRHLTIEELYELADALLEEDLEEIKKELGDLLLHILFYSKIGSEKKAFDIADVANQMAEKLIYRHPHIYGDVQADDAEAVKKNWEALKLKEGKTSVFEGVPKGLPAVVKALRLQEKAAGVGFDWREAAPVWEKIKEELSEFETEYQAMQLQAMENEFGDLLFSMVNFARLAGIDPESALERTNKKFISRFKHMEKLAQKQGHKVSDLDLPTLESFWQKAKTIVDS
ncbi:MAG: nucleoside triphosphate pyrophosphohydrolase [Bacteroidetes bacterium]|nr:nucleoside triphosphate pyrophosphohydrolase [Bacteroidota bacterium]MDA0938586.1 nucleoside triphosphate pyrophosphohydrolase [Bacteroidota bacterium]MDA1344977.1 nucleoside triphosphate pyrophosphohydrolase [Bacteroidota bacterium]